MNAIKGTPVAVHETPRKDHGTGRTCDRKSKCVVFEELAASGQRPEPARVNRYARPKWGGILLCSRCERRMYEEGIAPHLFVGVLKKGKVISYELPRLKRVRLSQGFSQRGLSAEAGVNEGTVRKIESGEFLASAKMAGKLARALGVSVDTLRKES